MKKNKKDIMKELDKLEESLKSILGEENLKQLLGNTEVTYFNDKKDKSKNVLKLLNEMRNKIKKGELYFFAYPSAKDQIRVVHNFNLKELTQLQYDIEKVKVKMVYRLDGFSDKDDESKEIPSYIT